jgi:hypothetical protein
VTWVLWGQIASLMVIAYVLVGGTIGHYYKTKSKAEKGTL